MCGRFGFFANASELVDAFGLSEAPAGLVARYNIAPTQEAPVIPNLPGRKLAQFRWGLIPAWAKDPAIGNRLINARVETLSSKPSFKVALKLRRCLVPASGFYEWKHVGKKKIPHFIGLKSRAALAFAGLWETWQPPQGQGIHSFTIITGEPNELLCPIHDRMPVILPPEAYASWLEPGPVEAGQVLPLLKPFPAELMEAFPVSTAVNNPKNDGPELVRPER